MKFGGKLLLCLIGACFFASASLPAFGVFPPSRTDLPDFDTRTAGVRPGSVPTERVSQAGALDRLKSQVPGARVDWDELLGTPAWVRAPRGFLSGPGGQGGAIPPATLGRFGATDPDRATKAFLAEHQGLFGHGPEDLEAARVRRVDVSASTGLRTVVWEQQVDGISVFGGRLISHTTRRGELVGLSSHFVPGATRAANAGTPDRLAVEAAPPVTAAAAVRQAAGGVGEVVSGNELRATAPAGGVEKRQTFTVPALRGATAARLVWLPMDRNALRLCWEITLMSRSRQQMFQVLVDARTGATLLRHCLTENLSDASYGVFLADSPTPMSPGYSTPVSTQPPGIFRTLVTTNAFDTNASPNGWINDGGNQTTGNNVDAYLDLNGDDLPDTPRPQGSPYRVFNPPLDLTKDPSTYGDAAVVNLFFWNNWMHDQLYELGFTEAAGNFQTDNFGRGGQAGDPVHAEAQDGGGGGGDNNASFSTPPDGQPGIMEMYVWTGPSPARDGDFDTQVILHEYTHGLSNRRVGGGAGLTAMQSRGLGEGWSDFYSLALLGKPGDDLNGTYPEGSYVAYQYQGLAQNYYYGLRRYPYSTDMTKDPVTFKDVDPNQYTQHAGIPISPVASAMAAEIHNQGEIWCAALWDARANLIHKYGFATGNRLILQLVTDGMNLAPANPTFTQARDAVIQADLVASQGGNYHELWLAFAKRGLGSYAVAPVSSTTIGVVESFATPDDLLITPPGNLLISGPVRGPFAPSGQTYTLENTTTNPLPWAVSTDVAWLNLSAVTGTLPGGGAVTNVLATINSAAGTLAPGQYTGTLTFSNLASGAAQSRTVSLNLSPPRVYYFPLNTDPGWTRQGQWAFGTPSGQGGGGGHGNPDPSGGATGTNVFGVNLNGNYSTGGGGPYYLVSGPLDFTGVDNVALRFQRWLNSDVQPYASATIEVSNDGTNWNPVFSNGSTPYADSAWTPAQFDVSAWANEQPAVFVRWGYAVTANAFPFSGWNLDDIELLGFPRLALGLPVSAREGAGLLAAQGRLTIARPQATEVVVSLSSSDASKVSIPATVTIPAGQTGVTFDLVIGDNHLLDGTQPVTVAASAAGCSGITNSMLIYDNETATLGVSLPASASEGAGTVPGGLTVSAAPATDVLVNLTSSDPATLQVPATVVLPAGQTSASFTVVVVDDLKINGPRDVSVTAHVQDWTDGSASMLVQDDETTSLTLALPSLLRPSNGPLALGGFVGLSGTLPTNLTVSLATTNPGWLSFPATVSIPAGQTSVVFSVAMPGITLPGGTATASITASAPGFSGGLAGVNLADDQTPPPPFQPRPPDLSWQNPVTLRLSWSPGLGEGVEQLTNGNFESGNLGGWTVPAGTNGGFFLNDGTLNPPSQDAPTAPYEGRFSVVAAESAPAMTQMYQDVFLPPGAGSILLSWADRIRNFSPAFGANQQFRVELRDTNDVTLAVLFSTAPGDALLQDWTPRVADISGFRGWRVRLAFVVEGRVSYLDVHLDDISLRVASVPATTYDVYLGTNAAGPQRLLGSTTNTSWFLPVLAPLTSYYWQVAARRGNETAGPVWEFSCLPTLLVSGVSVVQSGTAPTNAVFQVFLAGAGSQPVNADFGTLDGTALAQADYAPTNGTLTFNPGETAKTVVVQVAPNASPQPRKTFFLALSNAVNAVLATNLAGGVVLSPASHPPALAVIPDLSGPELGTLTFAGSASDAQPQSQLTFSLDPGAPPGAGINPATGVFTWTPADSQGPGSYLVTVRVTDDSSPPLSDAKTFQVTVTDVNHPPTLAAIPGQVVFAGMLAGFTASAADSDLPQNFLTFSLDPGAPPGAAIDPATGVFTWIPGDVPAAATNSITVRVTDDGSPPLSATRVFTLTVLPRPAISDISLAGGQVTVTWSATAGRTYRLQSTGDLSQPWGVVPGDVIAGSASAAKTDSAALGAQRFYRVLALP